jgi:hypothetical protein
MTDQRVLEISRRVRVIPSDLVRLEGSIGVGMQPSELKRDGQIFSIESNEYRFSSGIFDNTITLKRNNSVLVLPVVREFSIHEMISIAIKWSPEMIGVSYAVHQSFNKILSKEIRLNTSYTVTPSALITWLRDRKLIETMEYDNEDSFRNKVYSVLDRMQGKISEMHSQSAFWNVLTSGNKTLAKLPKKESDLYSVIYAILADQMLTSSIEVVPENVSAPDRMGFMLTANVGNLGTSRIYLEFKNAHSPDLVDGLAIQLPAHMESKRVEFGIYLVLWYGIYFDPTQTVTASGLGAELLRQQTIHHSPQLAGRVSIACIDLTIPWRVGKRRREV